MFPSHDLHDMDEGTFIHYNIETKDVLALQQIFTGRVLTYPCANGMLFITEDKSTKKKTLKEIEEYHG